MPRGERRTHSDVVRKSNLDEHDRTKEHEIEVKKAREAGNKVVKTVTKEREVRMGRSVKNKEYQLTTLANGTIKSRLIKINKVGSEARIQRALRQG